MSQTIMNFTEKYNANFKEKNFNKLGHLIDRHGPIYSAQWECNLRNDQKKQIHSIIKKRNAHPKDEKLPNGTNNHKK